VKIVRNGGDRRFKAPRAKSRFIKTNLKYLLPITGVLIIVAVGIFYFIKTNKFQNAASEKTEFINFAKNFRFVISEGYKVDADRHQGETTTLMREDIESYNPNAYVDILTRGGIVIQSFPISNNNNESFEKYVRQKYESDVADVDINFEQINENKVATVNMYNKTTKIAEFIKIVNLANPVIIASFGPSEALTTIVESINNIDEDSKLREIKNQVIALASLMQANRATEIYSLFTKDLKKHMSETDFKSVFRNSQETVQKQMNFNGGALNSKVNEFEGRIMFINPENKEEFIHAKLGLRKEKDKWLIFKLEIPKDND